MTRFLTFVFPLPGPILAAGQKPPTSVKTLFAGFDPREESLETQVVREGEVGK